MNKSTALLQDIRNEYEDSLITSPLLAELAATGGHLIPRALFFTIQANGERKARVSAMREPPSLPHMDMIQKAALEELREMAEDGKGAVCVVYSAAKGFPTEKGVVNGMALLDWQATDGSRQMLLLRPTKGGEAAELVEVKSSKLDFVTGMINAAIQVIGRPDSLMDNILERMVPLLTPVIRALAPDAKNDDAAAEQVAANGPVLESLKDYAAESVKMAMGLAEARAETVLAHMSMTVGMLHAKLADVHESHQEEIARMRTNWERQQTKTASKLQRELDMTRKRADSLARQVQAAREDARKQVPGMAPVSVTASEVSRSAQANATTLRTPLQRRMVNYLNEFPVFQCDTRTSMPTSA
jgi:hypothetical protein